MAHQVFVSHATEDRDRALQVCAALEPEGIRCWMAPRDVPAGTDYAAAILDGIRTSDLVLLIFSEHGDASPYVLREIERAVAYKRPVLALRIDDVAPSSSMEYYVTLWRKLDVSAGINTNQAEIVAAVRAALDSGAPAAGSRLRAAKRSRLLGSWSRRKKAIALAAVATAVVAIGLGLGLGLGLAQNHGASGAGVTPAQVIWKNLHPKEPLPPGRWFQNMVNDPTSGRLIMFGGYVYTPDGIGEPSGDTWAYDPSANTWTELGPAGPPSARAATAMAYDPATRRVIMFGGDGEPPDGTYTQFDDTWAYDSVANAWAQLSPAGPAPARRSGHVLVYDPPSGRILMFGGGVDEGDDYLNDLWAFDATTNTWTELVPTGALPAGRTTSAMAYDPVTRRMILFGGATLESELGDTWAYDSVANAWTELHPGGTLPPPCFAPELVCDPSRGLLVMLGGEHHGAEGWEQLNDTWTYDPAANTWTKLPALHGAAPSRRAAHAMVYDPSGERLIVFGGMSSLYGALNDTWTCTFE